MSNPVGRVYEDRSNMNMNLPYSFRNCFRVLKYDIKDFMSISGIARRIQLSAGISIRHKIAELLL